MADTGAGAARSAADADVVTFASFGPVPTIEQLASGTQAQQSECWGVQHGGLSMGMTGTRRSVQALNLGPFTSESPFVTLGKLQGAATCSSRFVNKLMQAHAGIGGCVDTTQPQGE